MLNPLQQLEAIISPPLLYTRTLQIYFISSSLLFIFFNLFLLTTSLIVCFFWSITFHLNDLFFFFFAFTSLTRYVPFLPLNPQYLTTFSCWFALQNYPNRKIFLKTIWRGNNGKKKEIVEVFVRTFLVFLFISFFFFFLFFCFFFLLLLLLRVLLLLLLWLLVPLLWLLLTLSLYLSLSLSLVLPYCFCYKNYAHNWRFTKCTTKHGAIINIEHW